MFWIWLIGVVVIGAVAAYKMGMLDMYDLEEAFWPVVLLAIFWPAILAIAIIAAPFGIPFYLGHRTKQKRLAAEKAEKNKV